MKRPCLEKSRISVAATEDKISQLPDDMILHIFGFLHTELVIPTTTLSKRWLNLWKKMENLNFDSDNHQNRFSDLVESALLSYHNPTFKSLTIVVWRQCEPLDLAVWVSIAFRKRVSKLVLKFNEFVDEVTFPYSVFGVTNTLKILKVMGKVNFSLPSGNVAFNCLKELHIYYAKFENEDSVSHLLNGCPVLEDLIVHIQFGSGVNNFTINNPSIQKLIFGSYGCEEENIFIQIPNLRFLHMVRFDGVQSCVIEYPLQLEEAIISFATEDMDDNILASITSVRCLSLCSSIKFPMDKIFYQLISLELDTRVEIWCNLLSFMFACSPMLETLKLVGGMYNRWDTKWIQPQQVAQSLQTHLQTLEWSEFNWNEEDDRNVAIYILNNAVGLKKARFTILDPRTTSQTQQREETVNQLFNTPKASQSCNLMVEESMFWRSSPSNDKDPDTSDFSY